jgi:hypothetical protein
MHSNLSIFILSYCRPQFLSEAVQSVLDLDISKERIIVLDNGSPENIMQNFRKEFDQSITWVGSNQNNGPIWNFKRAIEMTTTKYLMVLHDDDRLIKDSICTQLEVFENNPFLAALSSNGYVINEDGSRLGQLVLPNMPDLGIRTFNNSAQIAMHIYRDSCIPFSPTIYKAEYLRLTLQYFDGFLSKFGPVGDVILQLKLADLGPIAINFAPLYECRRHELQDSASIEERWNRMLREYSLHCCNGDELELRSLRTIIPEAYTFAVLFSLFKGITSFNFPKVFQLIKEMQVSHLSSAGIILFCRIGMQKLFK